jgi:thiamine kinase-like enzyme
VEQKRLSGGLEASAIALITVRYKDTSGRPRLFRTICKRLVGPMSREAAVYELLNDQHDISIAPRLILVERIDPDDVILCLEAIRRVSAWPWRNLLTGRELLQRLALFHNSAKDWAAEFPQWDYDSDLCSMAEGAWTSLDRCRLYPDLHALARERAPLKRMVLALPKMRRQLLSEAALGCGPIHGDVHPGNALARRRGGEAQPVLIDWGRARTGSPLEDVSSWLQSLGYWEDSARRRHDTLLMSYLSALGRDHKLTSNIRAAYWLAGASNALAGALLYHLGLAQNERESEQRRTQAMRAARDWPRIIPRADSWWS